MLEPPKAFYRFNIPNLTIEKMFIFSCSKKHFFEQLKITMDNQPETAIMMQTKLTVIVGSSETLRETFYNPF